MSLWVVVGGQYGSEGKGKVSASPLQGRRRQREIPLCATRRTRTVREKKPGRFVRNDGIGTGAWRKERNDDLCGGGQCGGKSVWGAYGGGGAGDPDECVFGAGAGDEQSAGARRGPHAGGGAGTGGARGGWPRRFVQRVIARTIATAGAKRLWKLGGAA